MFGRDDSQQQQGTAQQPIIDPAADTGFGDNAIHVATPADMPQDAGAPSLPSVADQMLTTPNDPLPTPSHAFAPFDASAADSSALAPAAPAPAITPVNSTPAPVLGDGTHDDLLNIKQQALQQLTPLVSHLEQSPEEKFRTTMMMIQAADDASLIKQAHEAALQITDEKAKAQALLDIVNEINYFTQHGANPAAAQ